MSAGQDALGFGLGLVISAMTAPVGISGAVFLLPVQVDVLGVPNPQVTPTNLLFNLVAAPGALLRFRAEGRLRGPLLNRLLLGALPGVAAGAVIRVQLASGPTAFKFLVAALYAPLSVWLLARRRGPGGGGAARVPTWTIPLAGGVGIISGVLGIGGGSVIGPVLVGVGLPIAAVAPAALACTFASSVVGAISYSILALGAHGSIAPDWTLGLACGCGGLIGSYFGSKSRDRLSEDLLRRGLGIVALALAAAELLAALH